jgi:hypothetical protein
LPSCADTACGPCVLATGDITITEVKSCPSGQECIVGVLDGLNRCAVSPTPGSAECTNDLGCDAPLKCRDGVCKCCDKNVFNVESCEVCDPGMEYCSPGLLGLVLKCCGIFAQSCF